MTMLNLETAYPEHISRIDRNRRVEVNFDPCGMRFFVCAFEPGRAERRESCWTLREAVDVADEELERIRVDAANPDTGACSPGNAAAGAVLPSFVQRPFG